MGIKLIHGTLILGLLAYCSASVSAASLTTLVHFTGTNGAYPHAGLTFDSAGNLYGTTDVGGPSVRPGGTNANGTAFRISPAGVFTTLFDFATPSYAASPRCTLLLDANDNLYGTTSSAFAWNGAGGSVFKISSGGTVTTLTTLNFGVGASPIGGLVADGSGNLYGAARYSSYALPGVSTFGTVFRVTPAGAVSVFAAFDEVHGSEPRGLMVRDAAGNLFGTTRRGGASNLGTVYRVSPSGVLSTVVSFNGTNGGSPEGGLIADADGTLYGTTSGTVFKISPTGTFTSLVSFNGTNGSYLRDGLLLDLAGNLYGTASNGGAAQVGTVFKLAPDGTLSTLHAFSANYYASGRTPICKLVADEQGNLYGTTNAGGQYDLGTVFKLSDTGYISVIADTNGDNLVNFDDLLTLAQHYGSPPPMSWEQGDFTRDGAVNFDDLLILAQHYGSNPGPASNETGVLSDTAFAADWRLANSLVPEPVSIATLIAAAVLSRRRRIADSSSAT